MPSRPTTIDDDSIFDEDTDGSDAACWAARAIATVTVTARQYPCRSVPKIFFFVAGVRIVFVAERMASSLVSVAISLSYPALHAACRESQSFTSGSSAMESDWRRQLRDDASAVP